MSKATKIIVRGDATFTITASRELVRRVLNADGDRVETDKFELIESIRTVVAIKGKTIPANRITLSPAAKGELDAAIADLLAEITSSEIAAHIEAEAATRRLNDEIASEHEAHARAIHKMMNP